jgi:hypothetical protein
MISSAHQIRCLQKSSVKTAIQVRVGNLLVQHL